MGMLAPADWQAKWIGATTNIDEQPAPLFRRELLVDGKIKRARAYVCGLGYYELNINGKKVGNHLRDPGFTRYDRRDLYVTYDVTPFLRHGPNAVGVLLGNGWLNVQTKAVWNFHEAPWREAPRILVSLVIEYADGRMVVTGSDETWKTATGPILFDSIYGGENYDARLEIPGWDQPGFDDAAWKAAEVVAAPAGKLAAQMAPRLNP
jgi:alpha-L-rhamnosidase